MTAFGKLAGAAMFAVLTSFSNQPLQASQFVGCQLSLRHADEQCDGECDGDCEDGCDGECHGDKEKN